MAEQGSYPMNGRSLAGTDTVTGVVTGQTADIPVSALQAFIGGGVGSGPTTGRPVATYLGQGYFDTTLGFMVWASVLGSSPMWVDAAGVSV